MRWFSLSRFEGFPTIYASLKTAVTVDVVIAGLACSFVILAFALLVVLPGVPKKKVGYIFRIVTTIFIGAVIMVANFSQEWETGKITAPEMPYRAGNNKSLHAATVGVKFGLRALNVTLKANPRADDPHFDKTLANETIDYNEQFWYGWDQGRNGFGPYANQYNRDFREGQRKGLPIPILWIAEYLTFDGEGIRWGRHYRLAGWYAHILQWAALPMWLLANILFCSDIRSGTYCVMLMGAFQVTACLVWSNVRNHIELAIAFDEDHILTTRFGRIYWLNLFVGIFGMCLGLILLIFDEFFPDILGDFFGADPLAEYEESHVTPEELSNSEMKNLKMSGNYEKMGDNASADMELGGSVSSQPGYGTMGHSRILPQQAGEDQDIMILRRRGSHFNKRPVFRKPPVVAPRHLPPVPSEERDEPVYGNVPSTSTNAAAFSSSLGSVPSENDEDDGMAMYENLPYKKDDRT